MSPELLRTKLFVPKIRVKNVSRPRLIQRLQDWEERKLVLVSAPAGFGKTTLLSEWIETCTLSPFTAWVSLVATDNDPHLFWSYIIAAIQTIKPQLGEDILGALQNPQPPPINPIVNDLINELTSLVDPLILVLDDFHVIDNIAINNSMEKLLENLPVAMHLVISSRADPPWLRASLRAKGEILELRTEDLRFNTDEVNTFINESMGLELSSELVSALDKRTEGWIAGLQLAALSMQGRDPNQFIDNFSGSHRFILDFLVEEVLTLQPGRIRDFLLKTSILDRMNASLCNALLEIENSQQILIEVENSNLFVIPLDEERRWYRYHHLFSDLLRNQLVQNYPDQVPLLHQRASGWLEAQDYLEDAVRHAFAAKDDQRAASLVEKSARELLHLSKYSLLSMWIEALPDDLVKSRPWLCVYKSWTRHWAGLREGGERYLDYAENTLVRDSIPAKQAIKEGIGRDDFSESELALAGTIATVRAHYAVIEEEVQRAIIEALHAMDLLPEDDYFTRSTAAVALGAAYWGMGDVDKAAKAFEDCAANAIKGGFKYRASSALVYLGMQQVKQGRLLQAEGTYKTAVSLAEGPGGRRYPNAGYPLVKLAELACEWNNLEQARQEAEEGVELCGQLGHVDLMAEAHIALARVQLAEGDFSGLEHSLQVVERLQMDSKLDAWIPTWLDDCRVRYWLATDQMDEALQWVNVVGSGLGDSFNFHQDLAHINLARILIAHGILQSDATDLVKGMDLLDRLLPVARSAGWVHESIRIMVLQSIALQAAGKSEKAVEILAEALELAQAGGYVRTFIQEGPQIKVQLERLSGAGEHRNYALRLLSVLEVEGEVTRKTLLVDELTDREMEVLRLLVTHLPVPDIAEELYVSVHTVRSHVKSIYNKLNVHSRIAAVERARELRLIL